MESALPMTLTGKWSSCYYYPRVFQPILSSVTFEEGERMSRHLAASQCQITAAGASRRKSESRKYVLNLVKV